MEDELITRILIASLLVLVVIPALYFGVGRLWNTQLNPRRISKGKNAKSFSRVMKEIHDYSFKEDKKFRWVHFLLLAAGIIGYIITGSFLFLLTFPLSFALGVGKAIPVINKRNKVLQRMFDVIQTTNARVPLGKGKNSLPPNPADYITAESWGASGLPDKVIYRFPTGQGPDIPTQGAFERAFNINVAKDILWSYTWDLTEDKVEISAVEPLPTMATYEGSGSKWNIFEIGPGLNGTVSYDVSSQPHALVAGPTGSGKSVLQKHIILHTIQHNDRWRFLGIDLKRVELDIYSKYKRTVLGIATELDVAVEVLKYAYNNMMDRYKMLQENGLNNIMKLPDPPYSLLVMIDEGGELLSMDGSSKTEEGKAILELKGEAVNLIGSILRLGRAAGVHMVIAFQRPDAKYLPGEYKLNIPIRIAAGRLDMTASGMILDSNEGTLLPSHIKGRGFISINGSGQEFQGYYSPDEWLDEFLIDNPQFEPSTVAPGGHLHEAYIAKHGHNAEYANYSLPESSLPSLDVPDLDYDTDLSVIDIDDDFVDYEEKPATTQESTQGQQNVGWNSQISPHSLFSDDEIEEALNDDSSAPTLNESAINTPDLSSIDTTGLDSLLSNDPQPTLPVAPATPPTPSNAPTLPTIPTLPPPTLPVAENKPPQPPAPPVRPNLNNPFSK